MRDIELPTLAAKTLSFIRNERLILNGDHVLVAVSGGPDSIALLHILLTIKGALQIEKLTVVHFDHQLRGEASAEDSRFVEALALSLNLPFIGGSEDVRAVQRSQGLSLEMAARICRYRFFRRVMDELSATRLALAHTADDQTEELLLRLFRGTGPAGMAGMPCRTPDGVIRPLLFANKSDIVSYINYMQINFRHDASNLEPFCQRNQVRLKVMPLLKEYFHPAIDRVLCRHAQLANQDESYWAEQIARLLPEIISHRDDSQVALRLSPLQACHPALLKRIFRAVITLLEGNLLGFYAVHFVLLEELIRPASGNRAKRLELPRQIQVIREANQLLFVKGPSLSAAPFSFTINQTGEYDFPSFRLELSFKDLSHTQSPPGLPDLVWMDAALVDWPLTVRSWQPGDRFQPLGMKGSKKLQDFFTDLKIPRSARSKIVLLCDRTKICWVVRYRLDERVCVTSSTKQVLIARFFIR